MLQILDSNYTDAITAPSRQIKARCSVAYTYPFIGNISMTYNFSPQAANSDLAKARFGIGFLDYYNDGTKKNGFVSSSICDGSGNFAPAPFFRYNYALAQDFNHFEVVGDLTSGEYPVDYTIVFRNAALTTFKTITVTGNTNVHNVHDFTATDAITKDITLNVSKWSVPNTTCKIASFTPRTMGYYNGDNIINMDICEQYMEENNPFIGSVISSRAEIVFSNMSDEFSNIDLLPNRAAYPEIGIVKTTGTEYKPMGVFFSDDWNFSEEGNQVTFIGLDIISKLNDMIYSDTTTYPSTASAIIQNIYSKLNCGLSYSEFAPINQLNLGSKPTWGNITLFEALLYLIQANTVDTAISFIAPKKQGGILYSYFTGFNGFAICATINDDNTYKAVVKKQISTKPNTFTIITSAGSVSTDSNSSDVALNGTVNLKISNNPVISNTTISARIADGLQQFYLNYAAQLIKVTWQGNMALEMNDSIALTIKGKYYNCVLVGNRYIFDGGMRCESLLLSV